jgi:uncharacterized protein YbbK (DUF523 family)
MAPNSGGNASDVPRRAHGEAVDDAIGTTRHPGVNKVLVSACLLGEPVRYDGGSKAVQHPVLATWLAEGRVVRACPELAGGLAVPRPPAERRGASIVTNRGEDVTAEFARGAQLALELCRAHGITIAVLKENSPSCGSQFINDGTFTKTRIPGAGLTTELLRANGVAVFNETQWDEAALTLSRARDTGPAPATPSP